MKTDPRTACDNGTSERFGWALLHDIISHPLMALTGWAKWAKDFHNWTSELAWPRSVQEPKWASTQWGDPGFYKMKHPKVDHVIVVYAANGQEAKEKCFAWFDILEAEFGGEFTLEYKNVI